MLGWPTDSVQCTLFKISPGRSASSATYPDLAWFSRCLAHQVGLPRSSWSSSQSLPCLSQSSLGCLAVYFCVCWVYPIYVSDYTWLSYPGATSASPRIYSVSCWVYTCLSKSLLSSLAVYLGLCWVYHWLSQTYFPVLLPTLVLSGPMYLSLSKILLFRLFWYPELFLAVRVLIPDRAGPSRCLPLLCCSGPTFSYLRSVRNSCCSDLLPVSVNLWPVPDLLTVLISWLTTSCPWYLCADLLPVLAILRPVPVAGARLQGLQKLHSDCDHSAALKSCRANLPAVNLRPVLNCVVSLAWSVMTYHYKAHFVLSPACVLSW